MKSFNPVIPAVLLPVFLGLLTAAASAETVNVPGGSVNEIQAAVDRAGAGGTVILGKGGHLMTETVSIDTIGVRIVGGGGSVIIGRNETEEGFLALFEITAPDVVLNGIEAVASETNVGDLSLAVAFEADFLSIVKCRVEGFVQLVNAVDCVDVDIQTNRFFAVIPVQAEASPDDLAVILVEGAGVSRINKNTLEGPREPGTAGIVSLPADASLHIVQKNKVTGFDVGIVGDGPGEMEIVKNKIVRCTNGMDLAETFVAIGWLIQKNKVYDNLAAGIYLEDGDNCELRKNDVRGAGTDGINLGGVFITVQANKLRLNAGHGIFAATNSCNFIKNKAERNGKGIRIEGAGNRLKKNKANRSIGDGIVAIGGNVKLAGNRGKKNGGINVSIS